MRQTLPIIPDHCQGGRSICKLVARLLPKDATLTVENTGNPFLVLLEAMNGRGDPHLVKAIQERRAVKTIEGESAVLAPPFFQDPTLARTFANFRPTETPSQKRGWDVKERQSR